MNNTSDDRNQRRTRALKLFEIEEREQQLASVALRKVASESTTPVVDTADGDPLRALNRVSTTSIADTYNQLQAARIEAERLTVGDPELKRLYGEMDGSAPAPNNTIEGSCEIVPEIKARRSCTDPVEGPIDAEYVDVPRGNVDVDPSDPLYVAMMAEAKRNANV